MTKLPTDKDINNSSRSSKNISDYHNIMKHPFIIESYGYDFLRNLKDEYKISYRKMEKSLGISREKLRMINRK